MRSRKRMDRILRVRRAQETAAKAALSVAEAQLRSSNEQVEARRAEVSHAIDQLRERSSGGALEPRRALIERVLLDGLHREVTRSKADREIIRRSAEAQRTAWTERRAAVRGLERLRERTDEREQRDAQVRADLEMGERAAHRGQSAHSSRTGTRPDDPGVPRARSGEEAA